MTNENEREERRPLPPETPKEKKEDAERAPEGLRYVFKIAPADPKNTLEFEDMADK